MRHLVKKIASSNNKILGRFEIGPRNLDMFQDGSQFKLLLDGHEVYAAEDLGSSQDSVSVVLNQVLDSLCLSEKASRVSSSISQGGSKTKIDVGFLIKSASDKLSCSCPLKQKPAKSLNFIVVPDTEIDVSKCSEKIIPRLLRLKDQVKEVSSAAETLIDVTQGVTRRKLVGTMWGASSVQKIIDSVRESIGSPCWNSIDLHSELLDRACVRLASKLKANMLVSCAEERKLASEVLIPSITNNFEDLKSLLSKLMTCVAPIVNIDEVFKKYTSYPGKFFISDGAEEDIYGSFESVVDFVNSIPFLESSVIIPIDVYRAKISCELKG